MGPTLGNAGLPSPLLYNRKNTPHARRCSVLAPRILEQASARTPRGTQDVQPPRSREPVHRDASKSAPSILFVRDHDLGRRRQWEPSRSSPASRDQAEDPPEQSPRLMQPKQQLVASGGSPSQWTGVLVNREGSKTGY
ncbi:uncharacterized protein E0L32_000028 [Thyridium curvatum]|uniref:Uncharacterized protein n=1 Tax=Thyridium curvatum TaxID=1093900 RepID=A0A507BAS9_9PEZI|nr:uncharacterized protein E0L32_000028 [Thyridium curvatum]TPX15694.1 hypothetical protein E0L32_000028 [Thyridium curvatum]